MGGQRKRSFAARLSAPRSHPPPDRLQTLLADIAARWRERSPYTEEHEREFQRLVTAVVGWRSQRWADLRKGPSATLDETLAQLRHEHAKAVFVHPRDDPWLSLCCWLVPRIFPSHYDVSLHQVKSLAAFYEIRTQPTTRWEELARRLVVDFDPYFRRHSLDPAELLRLDYDPIKLSIARLTGRGSSAYRSRANKADLNPLAPFLWKDGRRRTDSLARTIADALAVFAEHESHLACN